MKEEHHSSSAAISREGHWWMIVVKGVLMGAVEIVPGVSAGTLALITGILPRLLNALRNINLTAIRMIFQNGVAEAWKYIDGNFLVLLATGLLSGFVLLIQLVTYALENFPVFIWSFFFGLILASAIWLAMQIREWLRLDVLSLFVVGAVAAYYITVAAPLHIPLTALNVFLAGMIAISAMMLPGLSGSFMLMLAGMYAPILEALKAFQVGIIFNFMAGASIGILLFSHLLSFLFHRFPLQIYALLTGVMLGSLNRIWPWQEVIQFRVNSHGEQVPMLTRSISPASFEQLTSGDAQLPYAVFFMLTGMLIVWLMSRLEGLLSISEELEEREVEQEES